MDFFLNFFSVKFYIGYRKSVKQIREYIKIPKTVKMVASKNSQ
jgi:hypothetical protein